MTVTPYLSGTLTIDSGFQNLQLYKHFSWNFRSYNPIQSKVKFCLNSFLYILQYLLPDSHII
jgi:hypothetical protein